MIDKSLVKRRFKRSLTTYDDNAFAQKKMALKLISLLPEKKYNTVFEIGCATGILTKEIKKNIEFKEFYSNDIVEDSKKYVDEIISSNTFIPGDIENITLTNKYDLIISNACLQWCSNIEKVISKLFETLNKNGIIAVSIFGDENLKEIKQTFDIENTSYNVNELKKFLDKFDCKSVEEDIFVLEFENFKEVLKHLKYTGVNSVKNMNFTKSSLKNFEMEYSKLYTQNGKVILTYNPIYIILKK